MPDERGSADEGDRAERALRRLERRVLDVRHLKAFEVSRKEDGRFSCELVKPLSELTEEEARCAAEALEDLARLIRGTVTE